MFLSIYSHVNIVAEEAIAFTFSDINIGMLECPDRRQTRLRLNAVASCFISSFTGMT